MVFYPQTVGFSKLPEAIVNVTFNVGRRALQTCFDLNESIRDTLDQVTKSAGLKTQLQRAKELLKGSSVLSEETLRRIKGMGKLDEINREITKINNIINKFDKHERRLRKLFEPENKLSRNLSTPGRIQSAEAAEAQDSMVEQTKELKEIFLCCNAFERYDEKGNKKTTTTTRTTTRTTS